MKIIDSKIIHEQKNYNEYSILVSQYFFIQKIKQKYFHINGLNDHLKTEHEMCELSLHFIEKVHRI